MPDAIPILTQADLNTWAAELIQITATLNEGRRRYDFLRDKIKAAEALGFCPQLSEEELSQ